LLLKRGRSGPAWLIIPLGKNTEKRRNISMTDDRGRISREKLIRAIQEHEFAAVELNLYLDNFPRCKDALEDYNYITRELNKLKAQYVKRFGPLSNFGEDMSDYPWQWVEEPWPWECGY
jgi:spore coat protein JB